MINVITVAAKPVNYIGSKEVKRCQFNQFWVIWIQRIEMYWTIQKYTSWVKGKCLNVWRKSVSGYKGKVFSTAQW
jgi:hypothetical protein